MTSRSDVRQAEVIKPFKSTSRYLDDLLNIDNPYFECMVNRINQSAVCFLFWSFEISDNVLRNQK